MQSAKGSDAFALSLGFPICESQPHVISNNTLINEST